MNSSQQNRGNLTVQLVGFASLLLLIGSVVAWLTLPTDDATQTTRTLSNVEQLQSQSAINGSKLAGTHNEHRDDRSKERVTADKPSFGSSHQPPNATTLDSGVDFGGYSDRQLVEWYWDLCSAGHFQVAKPHLVEIHQRGDGCYRAALEILLELSSGSRELPAVSQRMDALLSLVRRISSDDYGSRAIDELRARWARFRIHGDTQATVDDLNALSKRGMAGSKRWRNALTVRDQILVNLVWIACTPSDYELRAQQSTVRYFVDVFSELCESLHLDAEFPEPWLSGVVWALIEKGSIPLAVRELGPSIQASQEFSRLFKKEMASALHTPAKSSAEVAKRLATPGFVHRDLELAEWLSGDAPLSADLYMVSSAMSALGTPESAWLHWATPEVQSTIAGMQLAGLMSWMNSAMMALLEAEVGSAEAVSLIALIDELSTASMSGSRAATEAADEFRRGRVKGDWSDADYRKLELHSTTGWKPLTNRLPASDAMYDARLHLVISEYSKDPSMCQQLLSKHLLKASGALSLQVRVQALMRLMQGAVANGARAVDISATMAYLGEVLRGAPAPIDPDASMFDITLSTSCGRIARVLETLGYPQIDPESMLHLSSLFNHFAAFENDPVHTHASPDSSLVDVVRGHAKFVASLREQLKAAGYFPERRLSEGR